jgi:hypothetical protein
MVYQATLVKSSLGFMEGVPGMVYQGTQVLLTFPTD